MIGQFLYRGTVVKSKNREISKYGWWKIEEKGHEVTLKGISTVVWTLCFVSVWKQSFLSNEMNTYKCGSLSMLIDKTGKTVSKNMKVRSKEKENGIIE